MCSLSYPKACYYLLWFMNEDDVIWICVCWYSRLICQLSNPKIGACFPIYPGMWVCWIVSMMIDCFLGWIRVGSFVLIFNSILSIWVDYTFVLTFLVCSHASEPPYFFLFLSNPYIGLLSKNKNVLTL